MEEMSSIYTRIKELVDYYSDGNNSKFAALIGSSEANIRNYIAGRQPKFDFISSIAQKFEINYEWLLTGRGSMLKTEFTTPTGELVTMKEGANKLELPVKKNRIPFYDDVSTIGGLNDRVANVDPTAPTEWIDAGDWFPEATAAIRHYGDSMVEYPSGSILALKRVNDSRLIINGRNYVIETTEYRVTKQLQDNGDCFIAYSTNRETYPDGHLVHSPFPVPKDAILHIDLVLGCVTKEYSSGAIQIQR